MAANIESELLNHLIAVKAIERQSLGLMQAGVEHAGDRRIAGIYRDHRRQTEAHVRFLDSRIAAGGGIPSSPVDLGAGLAAIEVRLPARPRLETLAAATYAHENLEIAAYHLLQGLAQRADDHQTVAAVEKILEEEEAAAEAVASMFDRAIEVSLGEPSRSPTSRLVESAGGGDPLPRARRRR